MNILNKKYQTPVGSFKKIILDEERSLRFILTGRCNLACEFCVYKIRDFYSPEIHFNEFTEMCPSKKLIKTLKLMRDKLGYNIVHFTGGEPTVATNIFKIAELARKVGYSINICSNLVLLNPIISLLENNLLNELTFSYVPLDSTEQRSHLPAFQKPNIKRIKQIKKNILAIKNHFPDLVLKTNIIMCPYSDINTTTDFIKWCWNNKIVPRMQRDRSSNRILGSTKRTIEILDKLNVKPKRVILRIPGATEICEFKDSQDRNIYVKVFNKNFRPLNICKFCNRKSSCNKSLSSIRIYDTKLGPVLCFCTQLNDNFSQLNIDKFLKSEVYDEIKTYKKNKLIYFKQFCSESNFQ